MDQKAAAVKLTEAQFCRQVVQLARLRRWRVYHALPGMNRRGRWASGTQGDTGWPDIVAVRPPRLIVAELKVPPNRLTPDQQVWLGLLAAAGVEACVWVPSDWDRIMELLA